MDGKRLNPSHIHAISLTAMYAEKGEDDAFLLVLPSTFSYSLFLC